MNMKSSYYFLHQLQLEISIPTQHEIQISLLIEHSLFVSDLALRIAEIQAFP